MTKTLTIEKTPDLSAAFSAKLLGKAIKARRTQSQLRLEDAAALCGVAKQTLLNIEHGHETIKLNSLLRICEGLGIKLGIQPWAQKSSEVNDEWQ